MTPLAVSLARIHDAAITQCILCVLCVGANSQIRQTVVRWVIIQVADHIMPAGPEPDERLCDHMGDLDAPCSTFFGKPDADPLTLVRRWLEDSPL